MTQVTAKIMVHSHQNMFVAHVNGQRGSSTYCAEDALRAALGKAYGFEISERAELKALPRGAYGKWPYEVRFGDTAEALLAAVPAEQAHGEGM